MRARAALGSTLLLTACSTISPVADLGNGLHTVTVQDLGGFKTRARMTNDAMEQADRYCGGVRRAQIVNSTGNGSLGLQPSNATVVFRCAP